MVFTMAADDNVEAISDAAFESVEQGENNDTLFLVFCFAHMKGRVHAVLETCLSPIICTLQRFLRKKCPEISDNLHCELHETKSNG